MPIRTFARWLRRAPPETIPDAVWSEALAALPFLAYLSAEDLSRLKRLTEAFLAKKEFSGAGGLMLTDTICLSIAVQASLLILNIDPRYYDGWVGIVVYPDEFVIRRAVEDENGVIHEFDEIAAGEAWEGGPVLISWRDVTMAGEGYNVVIHEFAHKLDMRDGLADGIPPLPPAIAVEEWEATLHGAFGTLETRIEQGETWIDDYATTGVEEFFAVSSEVFFEEPAALRAHLPALYALYVRFYRQDPARGKTEGL